MAATHRIAEHQRGFFSVLTEGQTYRNLFFFFLVVPLGILHALLIALGALVILGIAGVALHLPLPLAIPCVALIAPAIGVGMIVVWWLLDAQSRVNQRLLMVDPIESPRVELSRTNLVHWCRERVTDRWTWAGMLYLLVITFLGAVAAGATILFVSISVGLVAGSVMGDLGSVQITLGSSDVQIPGLRMLMLPLAPLVVTVGLHLANVLAGLASRIGTTLLGPRYSKARSIPLSSSRESAYAPRG